MYSNFSVQKSSCMTCNNEVLKQLGRLQGVFSAEIDRIDGSILVNHTDEITREEISAKLAELGWVEITEIEDDDESEEKKHTAEPSEWGCAL
jgi:copper chaperone CopZ